MTSCARQRRLQLGVKVFVLWADPRRFKNNKWKGGGESEGKWDIQKILVVRCTPFKKYFVNEAPTEPERSNFRKKKKEKGGGPSTSRERTHSGSRSGSAKLIYCKLEDMCVCGARLLVSICCRSHRHSRYISNITVLRRINLQHKRQHAIGNLVMYRLQGE